MNKDDFLRFSIQIASTGPSKVSQMLNLDNFELHFCQRAEKTPGIQSSDISLFTPYISLSVMTLVYLVNTRSESAWMEPLKEPQ